MPTYTDMRYFTYQGQLVAITRELFGKRYGYEIEGGAEEFRFATSAAAEKAAKKAIDKRVKDETQSQ